MGLRRASHIFREDAANTDSDEINNVREPSPPQPQSFIHTFRSLESTVEPSWLAEIDEEKVLFSSRESPAEASPIYN